MHCAGQASSLVRTTYVSPSVDPAAHIRPKSSAAAHLYTLSHAPSLEPLPPILVRFRQTKKYPLAFSFPTPVVLLRLTPSSVVRPRRELVCPAPYKRPAITNIIATFSVFSQDFECSLKYQSPVTPPSCLATALSQRYFLSARRNVGFSVVRNLVNERRKICFATQQRLDAFENALGFALATNSLEPRLPRFLA